METFWSFLYQPNTGNQFPHSETLPYPLEAAEVILQDKIEGVSLFLKTKPMLVYCMAWQKKKKIQPAELAGLFTM